MDGMNQLNDNHYEHLTDEALDVQAVKNIDGWKNVAKEPNGVIWGDPPAGIRRPVVRFTKDVSRAVHLARRMAKRIGAEIEILITRDGITVDAYCTMVEDTDFSLSSKKTEQLPRMLTQCALFLEDLRLCQRAIGETENHQEEC